MLLVFIGMTAAIGTVTAAPQATGPDVQADDGGATESVATAESIAGSAPQLPKAEELEEQIKSVEADTTLDEPSKTALLKSLGDALTSIKSASQTRESTQKLSSLAETAGDRKQALKKSLDQPGKLQQTALPKSAGLEELKARKTELQNQLTDLTRQLETTQETIRVRREEQQQLPRTMADLRAELEELQQTAEQPADVSDQLWQATELARRAKITEAKAEMELATQKLATYEAESELLPMQVSDYERRIALVRERLDLLSGRLSNERKIVIAEQSDTFQTLVDSISPRLPMTDETLKVVREWPSLIDSVQEYEKKAVELQSTASASKSDFEKTSSLIETDLATGGGLSQSVGFLLQRKRAKLPEISYLAEKRLDLSHTIESTQTLLARADTILDELPSPQELANETENYRKGVASQRAILQSISGDAERFLLDTLIPLGVELDTYRVNVGEYRALIDENLLWVRSDSPFLLGDFPEAWNSAVWLFELRHWRSFAASVVDLFRSDPLTVFAWLMVIVLLYAVRPWFSRRVTEAGEQAQKRTSMLMKPTFEALAATVMLALPIAMSFGLPGRLILNDEQGDSFVTAFADGLVTVAALILPLEFLRHFIRPCGIAVAHFGWPPEAIKPVRLTIRWVMYALLPLIFLWRILEAHSEQVPGMASLARIIFTVLMILAAFLLWRVAHPRRGAMAVLVIAKPNGWVEKLRWLWHPLVTIIPIGLAVLMLLGYGYSAIQLAYRLYNTIWIFIIALALFGLAIRWLTISRRRLAIQQLRERQPAKGQTAGLEGPHVEVVDDKQADLSTINQQSRRLVDAVLFVAILGGLYYTWGPVLPALGFLERVTLWQKIGEDGSVMDTITLANLLLAIPMLALTFIVVRNAPGLLETTFLQRLPLENAVRYAITTLTSYVLAGIGIALAAGVLGLHWSSIQWLIAGLGVGLGFGLQEIFANFISGIILLFEQPIRVGDIVTLDGTTGIISRIRMRATTITNWDRQEFVVPNKDFITGRLVNWTLTDTTNRVVVNVGIAYGSDTRKACEILQQICDQHPDIMTDPAPLISFEGFGDSTLNIVLRFYLASLDRRLVIIHEVHTAINDRFNEASIEIAFPQRDIHIRSLPESFKLHS